VPAPFPPARTRRRPRWLVLLLNGLIGFLVVAILATGAGYVYLRHQLAKIKRVDIPALADEAAGEPMNVLLVGSDSRERTEGDLADATGKGEEGTSGQRSDTIMVLHVDPRKTKAAILSIPRDTYVEISGEGYSDRINTAYAVGGAPLLVQTVSESLGIDVHHYVEVDFVGFERIVNTVDGVKVYFPAPARDFNTGLDIPEAGCVSLDGYMSLAYVRSRYYEWYEAGRWHSDPSSDFGRIDRQQDFIRRMLRKAVSSGFTNPVTLNRLIGIGVNNVTLDRGMSTRDIVTLARRFRNLDPETVDMFTLPTEGASIRGMSVQLILEDEARVFIDRLNGITPEETAARPSETRVRVLNGNGVEGAASATGVSLQGVGFNVAGRGDADSFAYDASVVRYAPAQREKAQLLASYLVAGATLEEDRSLATGTVDVVLVVGADYAGVRPGPAPNGAGTATTLAPPESVPDPRGASAGAPSC
jgi:LCP family protein required for cell wall assembly